MSQFNWLHLTDLHWGQSGQKHLWPNVKQAFFKDLEQLHDKCGPWQAVLFTGDFVQRGEADEFEQLDEKVLRPLWERLRAMGSDPVLLAVPGNHDLQRPDGKSHEAATKWLCKPELFGDIAESFWEDELCEYREVINRAFANYQAWWKRRPYCSAQPINTGLLPGEFSTTFDIGDNVRIGVLGLNTTFLQLAGGNYHEKLAWDVRQFSHACPDHDGPGWTEQHQVCLLMTHQGPDWLNKPCREKVYAEINPAGRFAVHLFGHMHEQVIRTLAEGGGKPLRQWQGSSLFGLEHYGDEQKEDRRHGYSASSLQFDELGASLRHWPRTATFGKNGWRFVPDHSVVLGDEDATHADRIAFDALVRLTDRHTQTATTESIEQTTERVLASYHQTVKQVWDERWAGVITDEAADE